MAHIHSITGHNHHHVAVADVLVTEAGAHATPTELPTSGWLPFAVPGTVASALIANGVAIDDVDLDDRDAWIRFSAIVPEGAGALRLRFGGIATIAEIWIDGVSRATSNSAMREVVIELPAATRGEIAVVMVCRSLTAALGARKPRPRWKTRLVKHQQLRWWRTPLVGRIPGWSAGPAPVGPYRAITLERSSAIDVLRCSLTARAFERDAREYDGASDTGMVDVDVTLAGNASAATLHVGESHEPLAMTSNADGTTRFRGRMRISSPPRWWPHTHGEPTRMAASIVVGGGTVIELGHIGFRSVEVVDADRFALRINGADVFARGASWLPLDATSLAPSRDDIAAELHRARAAGVNMLRISGTGVYETDAFYELCDQLGILVWQDFCFANFDYPEDPAFLDEVRAEAISLLARIEASPSLACLCGGSEVEQQSAMWGHPPQSFRNAVFDEILPAMSGRVRPDVPYVRNSPTGGALPFHVDRGVAHYFGVGAYLRPLADARRADVTFATECLAFANVPSEAACHEILADGQAPTHHPAWKRGVPRDSGSGWDFDDVRDHYLALMFGVDAVALRSTDVARYLAMSRVVTGEVMAQTYGEWRRAASRTAGGLIWFWRDLMPGAGWGVVDSRGREKPAYWFVKRAWAPVALFATDEGQNGVALHVINDRAVPLAADLRVRTLQHGEIVVGEGVLRVNVPAHGAVTVAADGVFGRFVDSSYAYRFGPPGHDVLCASLHDESTELLADVTHFSRGLPSQVHADVGLVATLAPGALHGSWRATLTSKQFAYAVSLDAPGYRLSDDFINVAPGQAKHVTLTKVASSTAKPLLTAQPLNSQAAARIVVS